MGGKTFVWFWAVSVVGGIVLMQAALFGTRGLPKPIREMFGGGKTEVSSSMANATPAQDSKPAAAAQPSDAKMVQPEDLPQGFIVVVTDKAKYANASSPIYMPSSHNGWNPGDPKMQLTAQSDMKWRIVWEKPKLDSRIAFKFARGSWETVEVDAQYNNIENRMLPMVDVSKLAPGEKPVIELEIVAWRDQSPSEPGLVALNRYRRINVGAGTLQRMEVVGGGEASLSRDALVWLPPGYDAPENAQKMYPVLYLMDGQNVFEKLPTVPAEWKADETAAALIEAGKIEPMIIVGVPHAEKLRGQEYLPFAMLDGVEPRGAEFVSFLANELKPRIDRTFRTKSGPDDTGIGGASLGAIIAMEAGAERPDVFGKVLAESMPIVSKEQAAFKHFAAKKTWPKKLVFGMGGKEMGKDEKEAGGNAKYVAGAKAFGELAKGKGLNASTFKLVVDDGALHTEEAWGKRLGPALEFLYPKK